MIRNVSKAEFCSQCDNSGVIKEIDEEVFEMAYDRFDSQGCHSLDECFALAMKASIRKKMRCPDCERGQNKE